MIHFESKQIKEIGKSVKDHILQCFLIFEMIAGANDLHGENQK